MANDLTPLPLSSFDLANDLSDEAEFYVEDTLDGAKLPKRISYGVLRDILAQAIGPIGATPVPPSNTAKPTVTPGTGQVGVPVSCLPGSWTGTAPILFNYQWYRSDTDALIAGATFPTYIPQVADVGHPLLCEVSALNIANTVPVKARSLPTVPIVAANTSAAPTPISAPVISGVPAMGVQLTCTKGEFTGSPVPTIALQWWRADTNSPIPNANGQTYTPTSEDYGRPLKVIATANNGVGNSAFISSLTTAPVAGTVPVNTVQPKITPTGGAVGDTFTCDTGTWQAYPSGQLSYQWFQADTNTLIPGAINPSFVARQADYQHRLRCEVKNTNPSAPNGVIASSIATAVITSAVVAPTGPVALTNPSIIGSAVVGSQLTCDPGTWSGTAPIGYAFQWFYGDTGAAISNANLSHYTPVVADIGHTLKCRVLADNGVGTPVPAFSVSTSVIPATKPTLTNAIEIRPGTGTVGDTLTLDDGIWDGPGPFTYFYQWFNAGQGQAIAGATNKTYTLQPSDAGTQLQGRVIARNAGGNSDPAYTPWTGVILSGVVGQVPVNTAPPTASGSAMEGQTLTAVLGSYSNGVTGRTYQWYRTTANDLTTGLQAIAGATSPFYTLTNGDIGKFFHMKELASNATGPAAAAVATNVLGPVVATNSNYSPAAGRIAPITKAYNGLDPEVPKRSILELGIMDADRAACHAQHHRICDNIQRDTPQLYTESVKSGLWSDPTTWSNGVPAAGMSCCIIFPNFVTLDVYSTAQLRYVSIHGYLSVDLTKDILIVCDTIMEMGAGKWFMGNKASPVPESTTPGRARMNIQYKATSAPGTTFDFGDMSMGDVEWHGAPKAETAYSTADINANATSCTLNTVAGWRVGDVIVIEAMDNGASFYDPYYLGPNALWTSEGRDEGGGTGDANSGSGGGMTRGNSIGTQCEERVITGISGNTVSWVEPLEFNHKVFVSPHTFLDGRPGGSFFPYVTSLSRSIRFEGIGNPGVLQERPHGMFMNTCRVDTRYVERKRMGRTDLTPSLTSTNSSLVRDPANHAVNISDPNNVRGRYPWHWHITGRNFDRPACIAVGLTAWSPKADGYPTPGVSFAHHTSRVNMERCVGWNVRGSHFWSEIGNEIGQWIGCIALWARGSGFPIGWGRFGQFIEGCNGHMGVAFDNQARNILMQNCRAVNALAAFQWVVQKPRLISNGQYYPFFGMARSADTQALRLFNPFMQSAMSYRDDPYFSAGFYGEAQAQIPDLNDCDIRGCFIGLTVSTRDNVVRSDMTPLVSRNLRMLNVAEPVWIENYSWHYYFYDPVWYRTSNVNDAVAGNAIYLGAKAAHFHIARGIVWGFQAVMVSDENDFSRAIDVRTNATDLTWCIPSSGLTPTYPPTFVIDNPDQGVAGGKDMVLSFYDERAPGDPVQGAVRFNGVTHDGQGAAYWPYIHGIDVEQYYAFSNTRPEELVRNIGCFNDNGTWKSRLYFPMADRFPPLVGGVTGPIYYFVTADITLTNFPVDMLTKYTRVPTPPQLPLLPEDLDKPRVAAQLPSFTENPFTVGPYVSGRTLEIDLGKTTLAPAEASHFELAIKRNGLVIAHEQRLYTMVDADIGQSLVCEVVPIGPGGEGTTFACPAIIVQAAVPTPSQIFGGNHKETWTADSPTPALRGDAGGIYFPNPTTRANIILNNLADDRIDYWQGLSNHELISGGNQRARYIRNGWDGKPCVRFTGDNIQSLLVCQSLTGITNPHVWMVARRSAAPMATGYPNNRPAFWMNEWMEGTLLTSVDEPAEDSFNGIHDFPKGSKRVLYTGCPTGARESRVNNAGTVSSAFTAPTAPTPLFAVGGQYNYPESRCRMDVRLIVIVNKATVSADEHTAMQLYCQQMGL